MELGTGGKVVPEDICAKKQGPASAQKGENRNGNSLARLKRKLRE